MIVDHYIMESLHIEIARTLWQSFENQYTQPLLILNKNKRIKQKRKKLFFLYLTPGWLTNACATLLCPSNWTIIVWHENMMQLFRLQQAHIVIRISVNLIILCIYRTCTVYYKKCNIILLKSIVVVNWALI